MSMNYSLLKEVLDLVRDFEVSQVASPGFASDISGFKQWVAAKEDKTSVVSEPDWEGKRQGRSPESVINTLIVHMNRYAKNYSKSAMVGSDFSTQEEFIYLINLKAFGQMTKMELIKKNIQDKPVGIQIIKRLLAQEWVEQHDSPIDKRSKLIQITPKGIHALEKQMDKIRQATLLVTGNLTHQEKMELIRLLEKLNEFHHSIYNQQIASEKLLEEALKFKH